MILRARIVLPVASPPIDNGAVRIADGRIVEVGRWDDFPREGDAVDLGRVILLPGLINAHCHLDYTDMAGMLPPQRSFTDWIQLMLSSKAEWAYTEFAESWVSGAKMLLRTGTTTVADFEAVPELLPDVWTTTPLRVISLIEMTGVRNRRKATAILNDALNLVKSLPPGRCRAGLAPHAPYSTTPELLQITAEAARREELPLSIHVAESDEELRMYAEAGGRMYDWLQKQRELDDCGQGTPVQHLERTGVLGRNLLAVHVNYLGRKDAALLARRNVSVVHCPRSHTYFRHDKFPFQKLVRARINVCLGTDSLATVYRKPRQTVELNMFEEMQTFAAKHRRVPARRILEMATLNGARALGLAGQVGQISAGAFADLIAIPFAGKLSAAYQAALNHTGNVAASMIDGDWALPPS